MNLLVLSKFEKNNKLCRQRSSSSNRLGCKNVAKLALIQTPGCILLQHWQLSGTFKVNCFVGYSMHICKFKESASTELHLWLASRHSYHLRTIAVQIDFSWNLRLSVDPCLPQLWEWLADLFFLSNKVSVWPPKKHHIFVLWFLNLVVFYVYVDWGVFAIVMEQLREGWYLYHSLCS